MKRRQMIKGSLGLAALAAMVMVSSPNADAQYYNEVGSLNRVQRISGRLSQKAQSLADLIYQRRGQRPRAQQLVQALDNLSHNASSLQREASRYYADLQVTRYSFRQVRQSVRAVRNANQGLHRPLGYEAQEQLTRIETIFSRLRSVYRPGGGVINPPIGRCHYNRRGRYVCNGRIRPPVIRPPVIRPPVIRPPIGRRCHINRRGVRVCGDRGIGVPNRGRGVGRRNG